MVTRRRTPQLAPSQRKPVEDRRALFIRAYLLDPNATKAAISAGYSPATAKTQGSRLLSDVHVRGEIDRRRTEAEAKANARYEISHDRIKRELALLGFANMADYMSVDEKGAPKLDLSQMTREQAAAIHTIDGKGRIKLYDKRAALVDLGKATGLFSDGPDISVPVTFIVERTDRSKKRGEAA